MALAPKPVRPVCSRCLRPQRTCLCSLVTTIDHAVEVLILQHPLEVANAKGSARLLHLSLPRSRLVTGEAFSEQQLYELLFGPFPDLQGAVGVKQNRAHAARRAVLLYPDSADDKAMEATVPARADELLVDAPENLRLVVLDGTWRKSRKMLYLNSLLRQLPRMPLRNPPASQYLIRKAHAPDQLSTLEATAYALMQLESSPEKFQPLLKGFNDFVMRISSYTRSV